MLFRLSVILLCGLGCIPLLCAQGDTRIGLLPHVNFSLPLNDNWRLTSKTEWRTINFQGPAGGIESEFTYERTDINVVIVRKTSERSTLGVGYLLRLIDGTTAHRSIQQFTFATGHGAARFAHRITTDQTFRSQEPPAYRLRYRLSVEIPWNGTTADPGESYLRLYNEHLGWYQSGDFESETRLATLMGFLVSDLFRFEIGPEYRATRFLMPETRHQVWFHLGGFLSF